MNWSELQEENQCPCQCFCRCCRSAAVTIVRGLQVCADCAAYLQAYPKLVRRFYLRWGLDDSAPADRREEA